MATTNPIDGYLAALDEPERTTLTSLRDTILAIVPDAVQCISYGLRTCAGLSLCCRSSAVCHGGATGRISGKWLRCWETTVVGTTKPNARGTGRAGSRLLLRCGHPPHREAGTTGRSH